MPSSDSHRAVARPATKAQVHCTLPCCSRPGRGPAAWPLSLCCDAPPLGSLPSPRHSSCRSHSPLFRRWVLLVTLLGNQELHVRCPQQQAPSHWTHPSLLTGHMWMAWGKKPGSFSTAWVQDGRQAMALQLWGQNLRTQSSWPHQQDRQQG